MSGTEDPGLAFMLRFMKCAVGLTSSSGIENLPEKHCEVMVDQGWQAALN